jgi:hypothetical protein
MLCGSSGPISNCHTAPDWHVMRLQSGIPVVGIAVVSIAVPVVSIAAVRIASVSIAEPHHFMWLQCWAGFKRKFLFSYLRENYAKSLRKFFAFAKVFAKIFHSECGSGFRNQLKVHPDPKHWWMIHKNNLKNFVFGGSLREHKNICKNKNIDKNKNLRKNFRESKNFRRKTKIIRPLCD